jgi:hypothetical protein
MKSKSYFVRYICPECENITSMGHYGPKSDMMGMIKHVASPGFCTICAKLKKTIRLDILDVECTLEDTIEQTYYASWMCAHCSTRWGTYEHRKKGVSFKEMHEDLKLYLYCRNSTCLSDDIRMLSINKV